MDDTTRKFDVERMVRHRSRMASIFELTFYYVVASLIFAKRYYSTGILKPEPAKIFEVLTDPFVLASFGILFFAFFFFILTGFSRSASSSPRLAPGQTTLTLEAQRSSENEFTTLYDKIAELIGSTGAKKTAAGRKKRI